MKKPEIEDFTKDEMYDMIKACLLAEGCTEELAASEALKAVTYDRTLVARLKKNINCI